MLLLALCGTGLTSCDDDDVTATPLATPEIASGEDGRSVSTLSFTWTPVPGAVQYAYELLDPNGNVVAGNTTTGVSAQFGKLTPSTTYTLNVWAFAALADNTKTGSPVASLTATTADVVELTFPAIPTLSAESITTSDQLTITWDAVPGAKKYTYIYYTEDGTTEEGETTDTYLTLSWLPEGSYTLELTAVSGEEAYSDSQPVTLTFEVTPSEIQVLWTAEGIYYDHMTQEERPAILTCYDNGVYTLTHALGDATLEFNVVNGYLKPLGDWTLDTSGGYDMYYNYINGTWFDIYADGYSPYQDGLITIGCEYYDQDTYNYIYGNDTFTWTVMR